MKDKLIIVKCIGCGGELTEQQKEDRRIYCDECQYESDKFYEEID